MNKCKVCDLIKKNKKPSHQNGWSYCFPGCLSKCLFCILFKWYIIRPDKKAWYQVLCVSYSECDVDDDGNCGWVAAWASRKGSLCGGHDRTTTGLCCKSYISELKHSGWYLMILTDPSMLNSKLVAEILANVYEHSFVTLGSVAFHCSLRCQQDWQTWEIPVIWMLPCSAWEPFLN